MYDLVLSLKTKMTEEKSSLFISCIYVSWRFPQSLLPVLLLGLLDTLKKYIRDGPQNHMYCIHGAVLAGIYQSSNFTYIGQSATCLTVAL